MSDGKRDNGEHQRLSREHVLWAYRLFLDREPEDESKLITGVTSTAELREAFLASPEYQSRIPFQASLDHWVITETKFGFRMYINFSDFAISHHVLRNNYDPVESQFLLNTLHAGDRVVDIGANIGYYTLLMASIVGGKGRVFSFEPLAHLYHRLEQSCRENRFDSICELHRAAVSDHDGDAMIRHAPRTTNIGGGFLASDSDVPEDHVDEQVKLVRLDDFSQIQSIRFIKIDVEGAEPWAFAGARRVLKASKPIVLSELHNPQLRRVSDSNATAIIGQMRELGYTCRAFDNGGGLGESIERYDSDRPINVVFMQNG